MHGDLDLLLVAELWESIRRYMPFIQKESNKDGEELGLRILEHAIDHYEDKGAGVDRYVITLAKTMSKRNPRVVPVDFMDSTVTDEVDEQLARRGLGGNLEHEVLNRLDSENREETAIIELALGDMKYFNLFCDFMIAKKSQAAYLPEPFKTSALRLTNEYGAEEFIRICKKIYRRYRSDFNKFVAMEYDTTNWRSLDIEVIKKNMSRRVVMQNLSTNEVVKNPETEDWYIKGHIGSKRIYRISYDKAMGRVIDLLDEEETNAMRFTIGESYICLSMGGSPSLVNPSLFNMYEVFRDEVYTNLIYDLRARILATVKSINVVYMLVSLDKDNLPPVPKKRIIRGVPIEFEYEDITDALIERHRDMNIDIVGQKSD